MSIKRKAYKNEVLSGEIMNRYILKKSKESSGFCKEIEAFRYNGNFNDTNVPDWFIVAKSNEVVRCWNKVDGKDKLMVFPYGANVEDGDYIVRQTNGTNEYVALANNATIQNILSRLEALEG